MLSETEYEEVIEIAARHAAERPILLYRLPKDFVGGLPRMQTDISQLRVDLATINDNARLTGLAKPPIVIWLENLARHLGPREDRTRVEAICTLVQQRLGGTPAATPPPPTDNAAPTLAALADALGRAWGLPAFPAEKTHRRGWSHIRARIDDSGGAVNFAMGGGDEKCLLQTALDGPLRAPRTGEAGAYGFFKVRLRPADRKARVEFHTLIVDYGAGKGAPETRAARFELAQRLARATMPTGWELGANDGQGALDKKSGMVWCFDDWKPFETLDALAAHTRAVVEPARDALIAAIERR